MDSITRHQNTRIKELTGVLEPLLRLPSIWLRRSQERSRLRREVGRDADRILRLELDIGLPKGTLGREMDKFFWQP